MTIVYLAVFFGVILFDQLTKAIVDAYNLHIPVIDEIFYVYNTRNSGAAFGMMADEPGAMALFFTLTGVSMIAICVFLVLRKTDSKWLNLSLAFIASGAIGNLIDRIVFREVRDFIYVTFFANFNVADIAVTVGGIMLVVYFLFLDKEAVFKSKSDKKGNSNENG